MQKTTTGFKRDAEFTVAHLRLLSDRMTLKAGSIFWQVDTLVDSAQPRKVHVTWQKMKIIK